MDADQEYRNNESQQEGNFRLVAAQVSECVDYYNYKPGDYNDSPNCTFHKPEDNQTPEYKQDYRYDEHEQRFPELGHILLLFNSYCPKVTPILQ
jgi:hypothetical protein